MKKISTIILAISISVSYLNAQNVNIPDANFKSALVSNLSINTNNDSEIQLTEAQAFGGTINASSLSITDLTGIEAFVNITGLNCSNNNLSSLNIANGSNTLLTSFNATNNPNLTCIKVDNFNYSNTNWSSGKDLIASYSNICTGCTIPIVTATPLITTNICPGDPLKLKSSTLDNYSWTNGKTTKNITVYSNGTYQVATVSASGCRSISAPVVATFETCNFPASISISGTTGTTATVTFATESCGESYEIRYRKLSESIWTPIIGILSSPYTITGLSPTTAYTMQMRTKCSTSRLKYSNFSPTRTNFTTGVLFAPGNSNNESATIVHPEATGNKLQVSLFPNPAVANTVLKIGNHHGNVDVTISDLNGKQLWLSQNISTAQINLPVQNLAAGMYLVTVTDKDNKAVIKLVKE